MTLQLLAQPLRDHLEARLGDAVARDPANAPLVQVIRAPLTTLQLLWRDALPTLRGDPLAAERLRVTIQAASDAAALVPVALSAIKSAGDDTAHRPGLVRLRPLAVLGIAAARVHPEPALSTFSLMVIAGLALQCGPAELLARLEPFGAPSDAYDNLLRLSVPPIVAAGVASRVYLRSHARDPVERARWTCILEVLGGLRPQHTADLLVHGGAIGGNGHATWSIAHADGIDHVLRAGDRVEILGALPFVDGAWPADELAVVGGTGNGPVLGDVLEASPKRLLVRFPDDVRWVGFVSRARVDEVNATRAAVRGALEAIGKLPCVEREAPIAVDGLEALPDTWPLAEAPPRAPHNELPPREPEVPPADEGEDGARRVPLVALPIATLDDAVAVPADVLERGLAAIGRRLGVELDVVTLPWVEDAAAVVTSSPAGDDDPRVAGLFEALARAAARTPGREDALWIAIVPSDAPVAITSAADAALGLGVASPSGLARCVARLLGLEASAKPVDRTYLAAGRLMVPSTAPIARGDAPATRPAAPRLRLVGRVTAHGLELLEPPREELRPAGPAAPEDTGMCAVTIDRTGGELAQTKIRGHRTRLPFTFAALVPISEEVEAIELRRGHQLLTRLERRLDAPLASSLKLDLDEDGRVVATWELPDAATGTTLTLEVSDSDVWLEEGDDLAGADGDARADWVPLTELHLCAERATLPVWRLDFARRVRLVACDGWNAVAGPSVAIPPDARFGPCTIRRVNDRTLWAELPRDGEPGWFTLVRHTERGRRIDLAGLDGGEVRLTTGSLRDVVHLEHRDVYRRA